jgi:putative ABC transport system permease protein
MASLAQAWRALIRRPTFTFTTVLTLALGIGVTAATFSIVNRILLQPLPFPDGDQLVYLMEASPGRRERTSLIAPARVADWSRMSRTFTAISGSYAENVTDASGAEPERLEGRRVLPKFFDVFAMAPIAGRTFIEDEERFGGSLAVVISEDFWTRRFGRNPSTVGSRLVIGGRAYSIVGVMPRTFTNAATDVWVPAQFGAGMLQVREARFVTGVGRMRPGVRLEDARADLVRVQSELGVTYPRTDKDWSVDARPLKEVRVGPYRRPLLLVFAAVGLLFAIAMANVAGLVLVQLHRRTAEFAVRTAIGASRVQVIGAVMREVALIALAGAAAGAGVAWLLTRVSSTAFASIPRMSEVALDLRGLAFVAAASVLAALIFGLLPAVAATRARVSDLLSGAGRGTAGGRSRLQSVIVVAQLALGVVLAGSAGLLLRSYSALAHADGGFSAAGVITFHIGAAWDEDRTKVGQFQERLLEELRRTPGVRAVGYANFLPLSGATLRSQVVVPGVSSTDASGTLTVGSRTVTPGYLQALSVPLLSGEWCEQRRVGVSQTLGAMVNRQFIERFAAGQNVVGRTLTFTQFRAQFLITGVVGDVLEDGPSAPAVPYIYTCQGHGAWPDPEYAVRADGDPRQVIAALRTIVRTLDPARPLFGIKPLAEVLDASLDQPRLNAQLVGSFATAALVLAALGLHGLLTLVVAQRRRELGVRTALGAAPSDLIEYVVAGAGRLVAIGISAGLLLTVGAGYLMRASLFGVTPYDPQALAWSVGALAAVAFAAVIVPARQAARVNAIEAMKQT